MNLNEAFFRMVKGQIEREALRPILAVVTAVDEAKGLIDCDPVGQEPEIFNVRVNANESPQGGIKIIPPVNSYVVVLMLNKETGFVALFSETEKIIFNGGENGEIINYSELKAELDKTKQVVEAIKNSLDNWTVVASDGGSALKTAWTAAGAGKDTGDYDKSEILDTKITH